MQTGDNLNSRTDSRFSSLGLKAELRTAAIGIACPESSDKKLNSFLPHEALVFGRWSWAHQPKWEIDDQELCVQRSWPQMISLDTKEPGQLCGV